MPVLATRIIGPNTGPILFGWEQGDSQHYFIGAKDRRLFGGIKRFNYGIVYLPKSR